MVKGKPQAAKSSSGRRSAPSSKATTASPAPTTQYSSKAAKACCGCGTVVNDGSKALQCDGCMSPEIWKCADCLHLTGEIYDHLVSNSDVPLKWFCESCDKLAMDKICNPAGHSNKLESLISAIEKLMERYESIEKKLDSKCDISESAKLDSRITQLEGNFIDMKKDLDCRLAALAEEIKASPCPVAADREVVIPDEDLIKCVVKEELSRKTEEELNMENRKRNIIIYRVPEKETNDIVERKTSDAVFVRDLMDGVFDMKVDEQDIEKMYRLGRWSEDKIRPLLVSFKCQEQKQHVMENLRNLKQPIEKFRGISVSHDRHPKEREEIKRLLQEAKDEHINTASDDVGNYKFIVVGQAQRRKVIKFKRNTAA